jgi:hypothetical protein
LFELPTPALPTAERDGSSLLPTPLASDGENGGPNQRGGKGDLRLSSAVHLLPTPKANDSTGPGVHGDGGMDLPTVVSLLPTPTARLGGDSRGASDPARRKALNSKRSGELDEVAVHTLLPTPTARDHKGANQRKDTTCLHGALTGPPSPAGNASPDGELPGQLSLDATGPD